jgi:type IV pilus assembly protein PilW
MSVKRKRLYGGQYGVSLIELMIAMTIGSFLILGITEIFIASQKSYLFQQGQLGNQENGRFTLAVLDQELTKAGYRSSAPAKLDDPFPAPSAGTVAGCTFPNGSSVVALSNVSLCIQYQAANAADVNCQGTALSSADKGAIQSPYKQVNPVVVERLDFDKATSSITCTSAGKTQPLVTGIADFRFEYGTGDNNGASPTVSGFSPSPTASVALVIRAVRYSALMQSAGTSRIRDSDDIPPILADWNARFGGVVVGNTQIYQIVQSTIMLRNQMQ